MQKSKGYLYTFPEGSFNNSKENSINQSSNNTNKEIILTLIADDHPYLIHGVEADLNKDPKIKIIGTAQSYDSLLAKAIELSPDVILHDLKMPGHETLDFKEYILKLKEQTNSKIIIFSNETGWARIHKCLELGASAYIEKAITLGNLAELIQRVYKEDDHLVYTAEKIPNIQFSPRQQAILHFIMDGKENDQIAGILKIDIKTVQTYISEIKMKLSDAFGIHPIRPRTLVLFASKLGFGNKTI
ncbi:MAG: response regulator transcription factor [Candidatus Melainabacteria bacterium]|nr:response regulator transcription factor [Candidatus Melainabacteria bacterium]